MVDIMAVRRQLPEGVTGDCMHDEAAGVTVYAVSSLHQLLPKADVVFICTPGTAATVGLLGAAELALLPRSCHVVNVGRATAIDEDALWEWVNIDEGRRGSYAADVWWTEPPMSGDLTQHPISHLGKHDWPSLHNVVCSAHSGGGMGMAEQEHGRVRECMNVVEATMGKRSWPRAANLDAGY